MSKGGRAARRRISPKARAAATALHWGVEPQRSIRVVGPPDAPAELVELGRLVRIRLTGGRIVVVTGAPVWLATDPEMLELYFVAEGSIRSEAPSGAIVAITYDTTKGRTTAHWRHFFHRRRPRLRGARFERGASRFTIDSHGIKR